MTLLECDVSKIYEESNENSDNLSNNIDIIDEELDEIYSYNRNITDIGNY